MTSDAQPYWDDCSTRDAVALNGTNIGDELNAAGLSWGWFQGGFRPTTTFADGVGRDRSQRTSRRRSSSRTSSRAASPARTCRRTPLTRRCATRSTRWASRSAAARGQCGYKDDYIPHHEPFQYYASTANPHHLTVPADSAGHDTLAGLKQIGNDTQSYVARRPAVRHAEPQLRHQ